MSKTFKDFVAQDVVATFFNLNEFAEKATIAGVELDVVFDTDGLAQSDNKNQVAAGDIAFFVASSNFTKPPQPDKYMDFNGERYRIVSADESEGVLRVVLTRRTDR